MKIGRKEASVGWLLIDADSSSVPFFMIFVPRKGGLLLVANSIINFSAECFELRKSRKARAFPMLGVIANVSSM